MHGGNHSTLMTCWPAHTNLLQALASRHGVRLCVSSQVPPLCHRVGCSVGFTQRAFHRDCSTLPGAVLSPMTRWDCTADWKEVHAAPQANQLVCIRMLLMRNTRAHVPQPKRGPGDLMITVLARVALLWSLTHDKQLMCVRQGHLQALMYAVCGFRKPCTHEHNTSM